MEWGGPGFVLAMIAISTAGWIATTWIRARHGYPVENEWKGAAEKSELTSERRIALLTSENGGADRPARPAGRAACDDGAHRDRSGGAHRARHREPALNEKKEGEASIMDPTPFLIMGALMGLRRHAAGPGLWPAQGEEGPGRHPQGRAGHGADRARGPSRKRGRPRPQRDGRDRAPPGGAGADRDRPAGDAGRRDRRIAPRGDVTAARPERRPAPTQE